MSKKSTLIINGKHYDGVTGVLLKPADGSHSAVAMVARRPASAHPVTKPLPPARKPGRHAAAHRPNPSSTLMRRAVKKPAAHARAVKSHNSLDAAAKRPLGTVLVKPSAKRLDTKRLQHAKHVNKSRLVSRFSSDLFSGSLAAVAARQVDPKPPTQTAGPLPARRQPKTTAELLDYALLQANAHEQESPKTRRRGLFKKRARSTAA